MARISRETLIAVAVSGEALLAMAVDHLIGTEPDEGGEENTFAEPGVFVGTAVGALIVTLLLFRYIVRRTDPDRAGTQAITCGLLAILALPLLFLAVPFPLAGAGLALGLIGREGRRRGLATAGTAIGAVVLGLAGGAYAFELFA
jgi:hypothetical protein